MSSPSERCLWSQTAGPAPDLPSFTGPAETDIAIVGGGFAGLSAALALAERGVCVTVLEAGEIGSGASGRTGGQIIAGLRHFPEDLTAVYGPAVGRRLYDFGVTTARDTFALIRRHGLQCDAVQNGWINAADSPAALEQSRRRVAAWQAQGVDARFLERDELEALTGTGAYLGGWIHPEGGSVQPLSLARELARVARAKGALIHPRSRVRAMSRTDGQWRLDTAAGTLTSSRLLLATNAVADKLAPPVAQSVLPVWSFQIATDPLPASLGILASDAVISDTRRVLRYFRKDRDGRLLVGGKGAPGGPKGVTSFGLQLHMLHQLFPGLKDVTPAYYWGGQVAVTLDRLPRLFTLGEGGLATVGCNGKGVAWNMALGPILADALTGTALDMLPLPPATAPSPIPFHGLKRLYSAAGSTWLRLCDRLESAAPAIFPRQTQL